MKIEELTETPWNIDNDGSYLPWSTISHDQFDRAYQVVSKLPNGLVFAVSQTKYIIANYKSDQVEILSRVNMHNSYGDGIPPELTGHKLIQVSNVSTVESHNEQGLASQLYIEICKAGYSIISDYHHYTQGKALWIGLAKRSGINVYVFNHNTGDFIRDANGHPIKYDGSNISEDQIWTVPNPPQYEPPAKHNMLLICTLQTL